MLFRSVRVPPEIQVQQEHLVIQVITDQALTPAAVGLPEMLALTVLLVILVQQVLAQRQVALLQPHGQAKTVLLAIQVTLVQRVLEPLQVVLLLILGLVKTVQRVLRVQVDQTVQRVMQGLLATLLPLEVWLLSRVGLEVMEELLVLS